MLVINESLTIPEEELTWSYTRSGGPGGQNVNKVSSCALLRWHLARNATLPADARERLLGQQRRRLTSEGDLLIRGQRYRDQERNRQDCLDRLREMILQALQAPRQRRPTRPTRGSRKRRLAEKRRRSETKERRQGPLEE